MKLFDILANPEYKNKKVLEKLICHHLGWTKEDVFKNLDFDLDKKLLEKIEKDYNDFYFNKKPLEYILGYVEFKGLQLKVTPDVLIPRPETEYMIDTVLQYLDKLEEPVNLIDIGTGCGVLGISLKKLKSNKINKLILTDISLDALKIAKINTDRILTNLENIYFVKSDLLSGILDFLNEPFIIVANLPYIPDKIFYENVEDNVKKREPSIAFLGGSDGLLLYRRLLDQLIETKYYKNMSAAFFEMMSWQAKRLTEEYKNYFKLKLHKTFHFNIVIVGLYLELSN